MSSTLQADFGRLRAATLSSPAPSLEQRRDRLKRLRKLVLENVDAIAQAIHSDFKGRARAETELLECVPVLNGIRHARRRLARWMRDERRHVDLSFQPARAWVRYEPLGVVGVISPWNYPLLLSLAPLTDALAAGNRVMLKPSESTPAFSDLLEALIGRHFSADEVVVAKGGVEVAEAFAALPFDHLLFTGSTAVGRRVARAAAENLTPVTLELGGKSPAIVCPDYPLERAARSIAFGAFLNAGQTCIAPDYVLAPEAVAGELAAKLLHAAARAYPAGADHEDYSAIISERHRTRLQGALDEVRAAGVRVLAHGEPAQAPQKLGPTIVLDPPPDSLIMREEIFGPILPVIPYRSLEEALAFVRGRDKPLALYCFTDEAATLERVLTGATSGGVTVNGTLLHIAQDDLPFGGVGPSGSGAYHGRAGFIRFSHVRAVHQVGRVNVFERLGPPWGRLSKLVAAVLMRL